MIIQWRRQDVKMTKYATYRGNQTFRTIDVSYHLWTFRTMDDSYRGLFVPSLDFSYRSYHGLLVPSSDFSFRCENFSFFHIFKQSIEGGD